MGAWALRYISILFRPKKTEDLPHSGGIYTPQWADKLFRGIQRNTTSPVDLHVVTDRNHTLFQENVHAHEFEYPDRDWSSLMEMFNPDVVGEEGAILLGLDTIITGDLTPIEEACKRFRCIAPIDPYHSPKICNAAVYVSQKKAEEIWDKWQVGRWAYMQEDKYHLFGKFSEMVWLREHLKPEALWNDLVPGAIQSWKVDLNKGGPKADTSIIYFHGPEKPQLLRDEWIKEDWK